MERSEKVIKQKALERFLNVIYGLSVRLGIGLAHNYVVEVAGRKSGRVFRTPVNLLEMNGRSYLVAPRGATSWVQNARAAGTLALVQGAYREAFRFRELPDQEKPPIIKEFLERYANAVERFYAVPKGSPVEAFGVVAPSKPVFELIPVTKR
ncbi:MAG: nitroreductase/quinone reductase family protein [Candidatus Binataceae bacterium]